MSECAVGSAAQVQRNEAGRHGGGGELGKEREHVGTKRQAGAMESRPPSLLLGGVHGDWRGTSSDGKGNGIQQKNGSIRSKNGEDTQAGTFRKEGTKLEHPKVPSIEANGRPDRPTLYVFATT